MHVLSTQRMLSLLGVSACTCDPSIQEPEAGGSGFQGSLRLYSEFAPETSLNEIREILSQKQNKTNNNQKERKRTGFLASAVAQVDSVAVPKSVSPLTTPRGGTFPRGPDCTLTLHCEARLLIVPKIFKTEALG